MNEADDYDRLTMLTEEAVHSYQEAAKALDEFAVRAEELKATLNPERNEFALQDLDDQIHYARRALKTAKMDTILKVETLDTVDDVDDTREAKQQGIDKAIADFMKTMDGVRDNMRTQLEETWVRKYK